MAIWNSCLRYLRILNLPTNLTWLPTGSRPIGRLQHTDQQKFLSWPTEWLPTGNGPIGKLETLDRQKFYVWPAVPLQLCTCHPVLLMHVPATCVGLPFSLVPATSNSRILNLSGWPSTALGPTGNGDPRSFYFRKS